LGKNLEERFIADAETPKLLKLIKTSIGMYLRTTNCGQVYESSVEWINKVLERVVQTSNIIYQNSQKYKI
jgi:hypothetical protein